MKEISGVFKHCLVLSAPVNPKREYLFCALYNNLCDFSDVELFLFHPMSGVVCDRMCKISSQYALLDAYHHPMHFYKCQELCVYQVCLTPNIYSAQQHSTQSFLIASLQKRGSCCVKSHWMQFAISPGTCNIAFRFPSSVGKAWAQINSDILQQCVGFVCISQCLSHFHRLICIHSTTVGTIKGLSHVRQICIWIHTTANIIYASVVR